MKTDETRPKVIGLGAGGHAKIVIDILRLRGEYQLVGLLDPDSALHHEEVSGLPVMGGDERMPEVLSQGVSRFFVGIGGVGDNGPRRRLFERAVTYGFEPIEAVHPRSCISPGVRIGKGVTVAPGVVLNASVVVGVNVLLNTGSIIEHDCMVSDHVHIASGAILSGGVTIGVGAHIGAGATVRQGVRIGDRAVVGAGAVVVTDIPADTTVVGVPARPLKVEV